MDWLRLGKKRMVYPEHLELDSMARTGCRNIKVWQDSWSQHTKEPQHRLSSRGGGEADRQDGPAADTVSPDTPLLERGDSEAPLDSSSVARSASHDSSTSQTEQQLFINQRLSVLVRAFRERAQRIRRRLELPPTPSSLSSEQGESSETRTPVTSHRTQQSTGDSQLQLKEADSCPQLTGRIPCRPVVDPEMLLFLGWWYMSWLFIVTLCFVYNCWVIPLRCTFPYQTPGNTAAWFALDYSADLVYLLDVTLVKPKLSFLDDGFWVKDPALTRKNYVNKFQFKVQTFWECYNRLDSMLASPYVVRMVRTLTYMLYLIHLNACAYYAFSVWQGLGANGWVFSGSGSPYIRCFYFATKTATSIGKNPKPETEEESLFMTCSWLMGVFVFAILIGQMRDIVVTATQSQTEYRKLVDETLEYMRRLSLPSDLQERVKLWFNFTWEQQHTLDERRIIDTLPHKLKTDIAINVHIQTLSKVQLFHDCDEALLRELVLKLKPIIFLPGDNICQKGEVGKEMYIVKSGMVEVVGPGNEVLATLSEGSVFGEISLLALSGGNRRTADVRSRGFSTLFVLSKADLNDSIVHYPEAQDILKKKARSLMRQNALREKASQKKQNAAVTGSERSARTPRLIDAVLKAVPASSGAAKLLKHGSRRHHRTRIAQDKWNSIVALTRQSRLQSKEKAACGKEEEAGRAVSGQAGPSAGGDHGGMSTLAAAQQPGRAEDTAKKQTSMPAELCGALGDQEHRQLLEDSEENTFQCAVTVHRAMSQ